jgi:hypothetical protein
VVSFALGMARYRAWLMRRQGHGDQANYARMELPDKIDTSNAQHAAMLSKYGVDPVRWATS